MNRRNFLRTTGASLVSLLAYPGMPAGVLPGRARVLRLPDSATAIINGQPVSMSANAGQTWIHGDVAVKIKDDAQGITVTVEGPSSSIAEVTLHWKLPVDRSAVVLNDHWERTYGDVSWHRLVGVEILPWYFLEMNDRSTIGCGVRTGAKTFCSWQRGDRELRLTLDTRNGGQGVHLGARVLRAATVVTMESTFGETPFEFARRFMAMMCKQPHMPKRPVYGINDWYFTYGRNSEKLILEHTGLMVPMADGLSNRPFSVIDAGWFKPSTAAPDDISWSDNMGESNALFPDMSSLAGKIRKMGMRPGIWTRPLCGNEHDSDSLMLPLVRGREKNKPVLDPSIPENLERVKGLMRRYVQWGYELVKFDYTSFDIMGRWGFEMVKAGAMTPAGWNMNDRSKTNAEIVLDLYNAVREGAGDTYVLSCNTFSHLSAGLFELNRIGDDTSGVQWSRTRKMGVNALAFRGVQHGIFYAADPDCVGLTEKIPWDLNKRWMRLVAKCGVPLFISAQPKAVGKVQKDAIKEAFSYASRELPLGEPLDWTQRAVPEKWRLDGSREFFTWE